jgi:hypothetical protein
MYKGNQEQASDTDKITLFVDYNRLYMMSMQRCVHAEHSALNICFRLQRLKLLEIHNTKINIDARAIALAYMKNSIPCISKNNRNILR